MDERPASESPRLAYIRSANRLAAATLPRTGPVAAHLGDLHRARACRYAARIGLELTPQALSLESCRNVPDWIVWPLAARKRLGLLTAVSILAPALAATMNGPLLRAVAVWTGTKPLTAILDQPIGSPRPLPDPLDEATLYGIGAAAMRRLLPRPDSLAWLPMIEPDPQYDWIDDPEACRSHVAQAAALIVQDERGAQS